jgi:hypothetical protein
VSRRFVPGLALSLLAGVVVGAGEARATEPARPAVSLTYELEGSGAGCPTEDELRHGVVVALGYDPFRADATHHVTARIEASDRSLAGRLDWTDARGAREGERRLASTTGDCAELGRGMIFALTVQIQLLAIGGEAPPSPPATVSGSAPSPPRFLYMLGAGPLLSVGETPAATAGARLFVGARHRAVSLELGAEATLASRLRQADGTGFDARAISATLAVCGHWRRLALCPLAAAGALRVAGFGVDQARAPSSFTARAGLRALLEDPLSTRFAVRLHADGLGTLTPRTVFVNELPVWAMPPVTFTAGLDLALVFR